jgi:hypothetical protein
MTRARCWNLRVNLDEFNAACWALTTEEEKALFLCGLLAGMNGAGVNHEVTSRFTKGHAIGKAMRDEAEAYRESKTVIGKLGGRPKDNLVNQEVNLVVNHQGTQSPIPNPIQKTKEKDTVPRKRVTKPKDEVSLEAILDGKGSPLWEAYWKLAGIFGPAKNPSPKTTARLYHLALDGGFKVEHLHEKALELAKATSDPKYLPQLAKWLEGEGYRNPTQTTKGVSSESRSPKHRQAIDAEYAERIAANPRELPAQVGDDPELLRLFEG